MASLIRGASPARLADPPTREGRAAVRDSILVTLGVQSFFRTTRERTLLATSNSKG